MGEKSQKSLDLRAKWIRRLDDERKAHKDWLRQAQNAQAAYFADETPFAPSRPEPAVSYPLFASTIKVIHGRVFSQPPKPDVRKRYADDSGTKPNPSQPGGMGPPANPGMGANAGSAGAVPAQPTPGLSGAMPPSGPPNGAVPPSPAGSMQGAAPGMPGAGGPPAQPPPETVDDNKLAQCIERALGYVIDTTDFDYDGHAAVQDLLVASLGVLKVEMETETESQPVINPATGEPVMLDKETGRPPDLSAPEEQGEAAAVEARELVPAMQDVIVDQITKIRHFSFTQFHWEPQQNWSQVSWVAFDHWMTKPAIEERFNVTLEEDGGMGSDRSGSGVVGGDPKKPDAAKYKDLFCVHEIWDKKKKMRLFVMDEYQKGCLETEPDPLDLKDFFPCPKPMMLNVRGDDLVPMPDYTYCAFLFAQCNQLTNRISSMLKQVKDVAFYDASFGELAELRGNPPDGTYIPIKGLAQRLGQAGGAPGSGAFDSVLARQNNAPAVEVMQQLLQLTETFKQRIYEIYGVPDILRGSTDPNETATAQSIKAQWADVRIGEKVRIVALGFRDVFRIMAEIMAEKFQPDILEKMTGIQLNDLEIQVLRSDYGRCYAIDVESDSTVVQDEFAEKQQRLEFLNTITSFIEKIAPAIQQGAMPAELGKELLLFATNTFKNGRQLEQSIQGLPGQAEQLANLNQKIQTLTQQLDAATKQGQAATKQLQAINMGKEQRDNIKTMADVQKTGADTEHTQVLTAAEAQGIRESAMKPIPMPDHNVVPIKPPGAA